MFRQDALENRKMKWQGRAILLPGIPLWLIMLGSIVFITAFLMFIIVGTYSRRVNVSGEVTTWPRAVNIYSGVQGFVVRQFVHEGQLGNDSNLLIVFYVQIMPDDFVMQLHRF